MVNGQCLDTFQCNGDTGCNGRGTCGTDGACICDPGFNGVDCFFDIAGEKLFTDDVKL